MNAPIASKHAGLLIPADMFRISQLASIYGELLVSKARNILDAELVVTRHPTAPILLFRITGSVLDNNAPEFWRLNSDLVLLTSRAFPRQVIMYYVEPGPPTERREGFLVAQQGEVVAGEEASPEKPPAEPNQWPVERLCQQLRIPTADLETGFAGGAEVSVKLIEPNVDDEALLMQLFKAEAAAAAAAEAGGAPAAAPPPGQPGATTGAPAAGGASTASAAPPKPTAQQIGDEDRKRRIKEQADEEAEQRNRAAEVKSGLEYEVDDLGIVVIPKAELEETDILQPFIRSKLEGDLPDGLPRDLTQSLQGRRIDVALKVDFMSEVFIESVPLTRPAFEEKAQDATVGGRSVKVLEVLGPRLGYGTLVSAGKSPYVYVSRKLELALPEQLVAKLLD